MPSAQLTSAAGVAAVAAVLTAVAVSRANRRRRRRAFDDAMPCGLARVERHRFVLPGDGTVPEPGHTRDTRDTRAHAGTRITRTNLTTIHPNPTR